MMAWERMDRACGLRRTAYVHRRWRAEHAVMESVEKLPAVEQIPDLGMDEYRALHEAGRIVRAVNWVE